MRKMLIFIAGLIAAFSISLQGNHVKTTDYFHVAGAVIDTSAAGTELTPDSVYILVYFEGSTVFNAWFNTGDVQCFAGSGNDIVFSDQYADIDADQGDGCYYVRAQFYAKDEVLYHKSNHYFTLGYQDVNIEEISDDATAPGNLELMYDGTGYAGGATLLKTNVHQIDDDASAADNLELFFDGSGYDAENSTVEFVDTVRSAENLEADSYTPDVNVVSASNDAFGKSDFMAEFYACIEDTLRQLDSLTISLGVGEGYEVNIHTKLGSFLGGAGSDIFTLMDTTRKIAANCTLHVDDLVDFDPSTTPVCVDTNSQGDSVLTLADTSACQGEAAGLDSTLVDKIIDLAMADYNVSTLATSDNIGINWNDVSNPSSNVNLSTTTIKYVDWLAGLRTGSIADSSYANNAITPEAVKGSTWDEMWEYDTSSVGAGMGEMIKNTGLSIEILSGGGGTEAETLIVFNSADSTKIEGARITVRTLDQSTVKIDGMTTDANGLLIAELGDGVGSDSFYVATNANNYTAITDTIIVVSGGGTDSLWMSAFDPGSPSDTGMCRVYVYAGDLMDTLVGAYFRAIPQGRGNWKHSDGRIILPSEEQARTDSDGKAVLDIWQTHEVTNEKGDSLYYDFQIYHPNINKQYYLRKHAVPDSANYWLRALRNE